MPFAGGSLMLDVMRQDLRYAAGVDAQVALRAD
jgi:hypothetical protein